MNGTATERGLGWVLAAVPLVGAVELGLHVRQVTSVVPAADWNSARDAVKADLQPDDLVIFAPFWADPLGRRSFRDVMTAERAAFSDVQRFPRAFEVSIRGSHREEIAGFRKVSERAFGGVTVGVYENPAMEKVTSDVVASFGPEHVAVSRIDAKGEESACPFVRGATSGGSTVVPQGLLVPADKFVCQGGHVGVAFLHALDHHPHVCLYATPLGPGVTMRIRFKGLAFTTRLVGHSGLQWVAERTPTGERISVDFHADGHWLGEQVHRTGAGWVPFELPTPDLAGKTADLLADVEGPGSRQFCFEVTTRGEREGGR